MVKNGMFEVKISSLFRKIEIPSLFAKKPLFPLLSLQDHTLRMPPRLTWDNVDQSFFIQLCVIAS